MKVLLFSLITASLFLIMGCTQTETPPSKTAAEILGDPNYQAISYGAFRENTRDIVPTVEQIKEDLVILSALNIKVLRTYNTQQFPHAENILKAIKSLKEEDPSFEMYVMLGAWIEAKDSWTDTVIHDEENLENNTAEIDAAVRMAKEYPDIVKIIAVGNEAMVHWAATYFVTPDIILKWVNYLQDLKIQGELSPDLWITSSDNFASWGGGGEEYLNEDLEKLAKAVDFISMHTYPFHDSHYNSAYWLSRGEEQNLSDLERIDLAMIRATDYAKAQYQSVVDYINGLGLDKPVHIGETGWASVSTDLYGPTGSKAADEYKQKLFHDQIREWTDAEGISCFYFEGFNEQWKDGLNPTGSENHFGLFTIDGRAKYVLWDEVDAGTFDGMTRDGNPITKTYDGNIDDLINDVVAPEFEGEE